MAFAVLLTLLSACSPLLYDDRCGVESRSVVSSGRFSGLTEPGDGYIQLNVLERKEEPLRSMWWLVMGASLRGHITSARLEGFSGARAGQTLLRLPVDVGAGDVALQGNFQPYEEAFPFLELFDMVRENNVILVIETDLPQFGTMSRRLFLGEFADWDRPHCS